MRLSAEQLAATAITDNLLVNAGAGSGKTTVLTARYIRLLEEGGLEPGQIVAITFTKRAAREMRERIDLSLAERAASGDSRWQRARDQLVSAPISTIHAFYARILRAFPVEANIDPSFRVLEEMESSFLLDQALAKVIQEARTEKCPHLDRLGELLGAQVLEEENNLSVQLREIYQTLRNRGIGVEKACLSEYYGKLPGWQQCRDKLLQILAGEAELAAVLGSKDKPELAKVRQALVEAGSLLASAKNPHDLVELYRYLLPLTALTGGNTKGHKEFVRDGVRHLSLLLSEALAPLLGEGTLTLLIRLERIYHELKVKAGGLDYSDLQFGVGRLFVQAPEVLPKLRQRYKTYMIDEFQDTDRLQQQIIAKLVEGPGGEIPPGRLFLVGDEKQSIYRFRGAEVRVFDEVRRKLTASAPQREKRITCNFRSRQPLIDLVNALFSQLMGKGEGVKYIDLTGNREGQGPCAELVSCSPANDQSPIEAEAQALAARIRKMVTEKEELVADKEDRPRPVRYGDIAVLLRARTHLREYEHCLRLAGIPYTVVGGIGFFQQQEIVDMYNLLRAVNNLRDELALAAVLRSPLVALDDDSLLALCQARREQGGTLLDHGAVLSVPQRQRLEKAGGLIAKLRVERGRQDLPSLVELALELTSFRQVTLSRFSGLQPYANLEKLMNLANQFAAGGNNNLTSFLRWLERAADQDEAEAQIDDEDSNSVKIMTIHGSKGLEFPVVFLPLCSSKLLLRPGNMLVDEEGKLVFKFPWQCPVWEEAKERERVQELEEYKRLLYVAITRARDWLVALTRDPGKRETSLNMWLQEFAERSVGHFIPTESGQSAQNLDLPLPLPDPGPKSPWRPAQVYKGLSPVGTGKRAFRYYSISQFMLWQQDREEYKRLYLSRRLDSDPSLQVHELQGWEREPGGAPFGSLLHSALELLEPDTDIAALIWDLVPQYFPGAEQTLLDRVFHSAKTLLAGKQKQPLPLVFSSSISEQEFYLRFDQVLFHGLIDRVLIAPDRVAILDYKTNKIPAEGIQPLVALYTPQLQFYALAAEQIYRRPARAYLQLLRLPPGEQLVEITLTDQDRQELKEKLTLFISDCVSASPV